MRIEHVARGAVLHRIIEALEMGLLDVVAKPVSCSWVLSLLPIGNDQADSLRLTPTRVSYLKAGTAGVDR
jgi:hypothetical protein